MEIDNEHSYIVYTSSQIAQKSIQLIIETFSSIFSCESTIIKQKTTTKRERKK